MVAADWSSGGWLVFSHAHGPALRVLRADEGCDHTATLATCALFGHAAAPRDADAGRLPRPEHGKIFQCWPEKLLLGSTRRFDGQPCCPGSPPAARILDSDVVGA